VSVDVIAEQHRQELQKLQDEARMAAPRVSFDEARVQAVKIRSRALSLMSDTLKNAKMGAKLDLHAIDQLSGDIISSLSDNNNALATMIRLRDKDQYLLEHSFSVAVLMGLLARSLGFMGEALQPLVEGGLLHDIGKTRVPLKILNKPGSLEPAEWAEMKRHVDYGVEILNTMPGVPDTAKIICLQHHERLDGTGYPFRRPAEKISRYGRMGAVVDVYDAITADRVYHRGMSPTLALRKMLEWSGNHLDRDLVYQLIRCISIYPPGSLVQLSSGVVAVVREVNAIKQQRPVVEIIYDTGTARMLPRQVLDLTLDTGFGEVVKACEPGAFGINLPDFI
jgi:putative nucleotidyltransferase with HDIG domain